MVLLWKLQSRSWAAGSLSFPIVLHFSYMLTNSVMQVLFCTVILLAAT